MVIGIGLNQTNSRDLAKTLGMSHSRIAYANMILDQLSPAHPGDSPLTCADPLRRCLWTCNCPGWDVRVYRECAHKGGS